MRALINIFPGQSPKRLQQTHLLILALLNFDHTVHIVFHDGSERTIQHDTELNKKWQALPLYGARDFLFLSGQYTNLSTEQFHRIKQRADFIS